MTRSRMQQVLGALWLLDGLLQLQPAMFTPWFAQHVLLPAADGQPAFVAWPIDLVAHLVVQAPVVCNLAFAGLQLGLGALLLRRRHVRLALTVSIGWGLAVWWLGEGLGGLPSGHASLLTGAPGPALLYAVLALAAWPAATERPNRTAVLAWSAIWGGGAVLQLLPGQNDGRDLSAAVAATRADAPAWWHGAVVDVARAVPSGHAVAVALAVVQLAVALLAGVPGAARRAGVVAGCLLAVAFFAFGQALGGFTARATDPGSAPLLVVLGIAALAVIRSPGRHEHTTANPDPVGGTPMLSRSLVVKAGAAAVVVALGATACGGSSTGGTTSAQSSPSQSPASAAAMATASTDATATQAAALRAGLDQLFREHVDLTGFVVQTAVTNGVGSAQTAAALKALDANTVALADAVGSIYGAAARSSFLTTWRNHIGFFVEYTEGLAAHDTAKVQEAQTKLAGYKTDFAKFLGAATQIPPTAIANELQGHIDTLEAAIQAIISKSRDAGAKLQMAAMHMDGTAAALAAGIAKQKSLSGNSDGAAATLRAELTGLLVQHVAQTGEVVQSAVATGLSSAQTTGALAALDRNTQDLGAAIGSVYGTAAQTAFLKMWRAHIGFFVDYTKGLATGDKAAVAKAQQQLAGYRTQFADFLGSATGLPAAAISADLGVHVQTLEAAIVAIVHKSPSAAAKISMAEDHMAGTATVLAKAIAAQKHLA